MEILTVNEVAKILRIHPATVYRLNAEGAIECIRIGKAIRFRMSDIEAYLDRGGNRVGGEKGE